MNETLSTKRDTHSIPRILIAGSGSGCGKTTITCAILKALINKGLVIQSLKCGPDYIDPMLHSHITSRACRNLDPYFLEEQALNDVLVKNSHTADLTVIEGVMGYYDGIGLTGEGSTHSISMMTQTPTILVINAKGMATTLIAVIKGLVEYRRNQVKGIILNNCSKHFYDMLKPVLEEELQLELLGYFSNNANCVIGSRHLGLMTAGDIENLDDIVNELGDMAAKTLNLERIIQLAHLAPRMQGSRESVDQRDTKDQVSIGVAKDSAFCFYYKDNLEALEECGANIVYFSPTTEKELPEGIKGIYLGGGYPEIYASELSQNTSMRTEIKNKILEGMPVIAECGGYMYLKQTIIDSSGMEHSMAGVIDGTITMTNGLNKHFGYVELISNKDNLLVPCNTPIRAHEFHYSKADIEGDGFLIRKNSGKQWEGIHSSDTMYAGYPHLYFRNHMDMVKRFLKKAKENG